MRFPPAAPRRALPRAAAAGAIAAACMFGAAAPAFAAPDDAADPLANLLADKGLLASPAAPAQTQRAAAALLRQVHDRTAEIAAAALDFIGVHYRRGGTSAQTGFDCSGFTRHVFEMSLGLVLPRRADEQAAAPGLVAVKREDLQPGDLVFFNTLRRTFSHVGIYLGANRFVHAPHSGAQVRTEDIRFAYWAKRFTGARRFAASAAPAARTGDPAAPSAQVSSGS
jgi:cell wall-associated NlpC family hydrolase